jgi:hypothetical protein
MILKGGLSANRRLLNDARKDYAADDQWALD